jgi:hypothetical protein
MSRSYFKEKTSYPFWIISSLFLAMLLPFLIVFFKEDVVPKEVYWSMIPMVLVGILFFSIKLDLRVDIEGIEVKFVPFVNKTKKIRWDELKEAKVLKTQPIKDFGGWGYRVKYKAKAYTLYGNWCLSIKYHDDKRLLIGIRDHQALDQLLQNTVYPHYPQLNKQADLS